MKKTVRRPWLTLGSWKRNSIAIGILLAFYVAFGAVMTYGQQAFIYQPGTESFADCPALAEAEQAIFKGTRMYIKENGPRVAVIYHGNAGRACDRAFIAALFERAGYSYVLPEYAGYAGDGATPTHEALRADVDHVVAFLKTRGREDTTVFGESVGTGLASYHASIAPPQKLILVSPFTSLMDVARAKFWYYPVSLLVDNAYDNEKLLAGYTERVLVIHGAADTLIPTRLGKALFASLTANRKQLVIVEHAGHNDLFLFPETEEAIRKFLR